MNLTVFGPSSSTISISASSSKNYTSNPSVSPLTSGFTKFKGSDIMPSNISENSLLVSTSTSSFVSTMLTSTFVDRTPKKSSTLFSLTHASESSGLAALASTSYGSVIKSSEFIPSSKVNSLILNATSPKRAKLPTFSPSTSVLLNNESPFSTTSIIDITNETPNSNNTTEESTSSPGVTVLTQSTITNSDGRTKPHSNLPWNTTAKHLITASFHTDSYVAPSTIKHINSTFFVTPTAIQGRVNTQSFITSSNEIDSQTNILSTEAPILTMTQAFIESKSLQVLSSPNKSTLTSVETSSTELPTNYVLINSTVLSKELSRINTVHTSSTVIGKASIQTATLINTNAQFDKPSSKYFQASKTSSVGMGNPITTSYNNIIAAYNATDQISFDAFINILGVKLSISGLIGAIVFLALVIVVAILLALIYFQKGCIFFKKNKRTRVLPVVAFENVANNTVPMKANEEAKQTLWRNGSVEDNDTPIIAGPPSRVVNSTFSAKNNISELL